MFVPRALILRAPGTNCDYETAFAFEQAGGAAERVHVNRLLENPRLADDFQILCLPGGFSYGDDVAAGRILGNQIRHHLRDALRKFRDDGKLILGICNGFQILIKSGLLFDDDPQHGPAATLTWNDSGRYTDRWIHVRVCGDRSPFLTGVEEMYLPIAHAEGRFVMRDTTAAQELDKRAQLVLRYAMPGDDGSETASCELRTATVGRKAGSTTAGSSTATIAAPAERLPFPHNPNGAQANVAGMCDVTGRVFGMMPHPERHIDPTHHPRWTRGEAGEVGDGLRIFQNAVRFFE